MGGRANDGYGQVGGMLAALLDVPFASLVNLIGVLDPKKLKVGKGAARIRRLDYFVPEMGEGAEMLEGSMDEIVEKVVELLKAKGGLK